MASRPISEQIQVLVSLQELDLQIDVLTKKKNLLPQGLQDANSRLAQAQTLLKSRKNAAEELDKNIKQSQAAQQISEDRLQRSVGRQEGVKNSQEYQAVAKEVEQVRKSISQFKDQITKAEAELVKANALIEESNTQVAQVEAEIATISEGLSGEGNVLEQELNEFMKKRGSLTPGVDVPILRQYDRIRGARGGIGITPVVNGGRCSGCNMSLPPQLYNVMRKLTSIESCPSCNRLVFVPVASPAPEASASV